MRKLRKLMDPSVTLSSSEREGDIPPLKKLIAQRRDAGDPPPPAVPETCGRVRSLYT